MSFLFIINTLKLITVTKPAAALMWINVYNMYVTGEFATIIADIPTEPSNEPLFCTSSLIIHGVFFLSFAISPWGPLLPLLSLIN
jgi:hypothetical protein